MGKYTQLDRYLETAETYKKKGDRAWARAKNGEGGYNYGVARDAYERAERNRRKAYSEMENIILNEDDR